MKFGKQDVQLLHLKQRGLVLGFFDGFHTAHQVVVKSALEYADNAVIITFKDSPAKYFNKEFEYIMPRNKTLEKIKSFGVEHIIELDFAEIASVSAEDYLKFLVKNFNPISISTGFNHTFGKNKLGTPEFLELNSAKYGYKYICVPPQKSEGEIVSSTLIKKLLKEGNINKANKALCNNFSIEGKVIKGAQIGRTIGFPTANINYPKNIVKIPFGVYSAQVFNKPAILNWGMKPTVNNTKEPVAEVHIINFNDDLYDKKIEIEILDKIRNEKKFNNLEELKYQINKDIEKCLE